MFASNLGSVHRCRRRCVPALILGFHLWYSLHLLDLISSRYPWKVDNLLLNLTICLSVLYHHDAPAFHIFILQCSESTNAFHQLPSRPTVVISKFPLARNARLKCKTVLQTVLAKPDIAACVPSLCRPLLETPVVNRAARGNDRSPSHLLRILLASASLRACLLDIHETHYTCHSC